MAALFDTFVGVYCEVLPATRAVAARCAGMRATFRAAGTPRAPYEMLIAATAHEHDLVLATRNVRDFADCGLRLVNPFDA